MDVAILACDGYWHLMLSQIALGYARQLIPQIM